MTTRKPAGMAPTGRELASVFDSIDPLTVGIEEEVMLLDPTSFDLVPHALELLGRIGPDDRFKAELPASQLEIVTPPFACAVDAVAALTSSRRELAEAADGLARPVAVGVHPFAAPEGELVDAPRYREIRGRYEPVLRRQLVASLHVHVALGDAQRTLRVHNALRGYLPEIAALAANAAFHEGRDTGLASVRPLIATTLPRQGVPPPIESWESHAASLRWVSFAGGFRKAQTWWWELRPNVAFGTLEVRVPDAQTSVDDAAAITAFVHSLIGWLAERSDSEEEVEEAAGWRIEENRWSAARHGVDGEMADLQSGEREPTRARLRRLLRALGPVAERLGCAGLLASAGRLVETNGAMRQREVASEAGAHGLVEWLASGFLGDPALLDEDHG